MPSGDLVPFLTPLGLAHYAKTFEEEEIHSTDLLKSMGEEMFRESMEELEMKAADVEKLCKALFGGDSGADDEGGWTARELGTCWKHGGRTRKALFPQGIWLYVCLRALICKRYI